MTDDPRNHAPRMTWTQGQPLSVLDADLSRIGQWFSECERLDKAESPMTEIERLTAIAWSESPKTADAQWQDFRVVVRAILQAMREPSEGTKAAMWEAYPPPGYDQGGDPVEVLHAAIDHILSETP